jgi:lipid A 3-O-deacylase
VCTNEDQSFSLFLSVLIRVIRGRCSVLFPRIFSLATLVPCYILRFLGKPMKRLFALMIVLCAAASAQTPLARAGAWELGPWAGGGVALGKSSDIHFVSAGFRIGAILTEQLGTSRFRGNLEWAADLIPLYLVYQPNRVYGGSFNPVVLKWNFTAGKRMVPYVAAEAGVLFTRTEVPPGDTSSVNFTPTLASGVYIFQNAKRALELSVHVTHISSANLGNKNPGINSSLQFRVGYFWFK